MKAIVNTAAGRVQWQDWPLPEPGPGQVRIRTAACGVCATDLHMIAGWQRTSFPAIPGHEWSGTVDAVGSEADRALLGRCCVAENVLADGGEVGFEHAGGYGQYFLTEAKNVYPLPDEFPPAVAALIEPLAVCVRALRRLRLEDRGWALVLGDGPIDRRDHLERARRHGTGLRLGHPERQGCLGPGTFSFLPVEDRTVVGSASTSLRIVAASLTMPVQTVACRFLSLAVWRPSGVLRSHPNRSRQLSCRC
jgi:hypothetical protein